MTLLGETAATLWFWQNLQPKLQPALPMENVFVPGKK
jgi:hypothetical protein